MNAWNAFRKWNWNSNDLCSRPQFSILDSRIRFWLRKVRDSIWNTLFDMHSFSLNSWTRNCSHGKRCTQTDIVRGKFPIVNENWKQRTEMAKLIRKCNSKTFSKGLMFNVRAWKVGIVLNMQLYYCKAYIIIIFGLWSSSYVLWEQYSLLRWSILMLWDAQKYSKH